MCVASYCYASFRLRQAYLDDIRVAMNSYYSYLPIYNSSTQSLFISSSAFVADLREEYSFCLIGDRYDIVS